MDAHRRHLEESLRLPNGEPDETHKLLYILGAQTIDLAFRRDL